MSDREKSKDNIPLVSVEDIIKTFGAVQALKGISFDIPRGEVVARVGDNGAGKSTLVKIIAGVHSPSSGTLKVRGDPVHFDTPADARDAGIETVYQHLALIEQLDVSGNVYLGREKTTGGWLGKVLGLLDFRQMRDDTAETLETLHINIPEPTLAVRNMSGGQRQVVAIGRAVMWGQELLILDEPTAALGVEETEQVLSLIERLRDERHFTFLVISHNMQNVYRIADTIVVLRQGQHIATLNKADTSPEEIVGYITGAKDATGTGYA